MTRIIWTWKAGVLPKTRRMMSNRLAMAGLELRNEHRKNLDRPYPPASVPGEFPARRTGRLRDGVLLEVEPTRALILETTPYWVYLWRRNRLMLGTTFRQMRNRLAKIMLKGS